MTQSYPIYCRQCRGQNTFERNPSKDIMTETNQAFELSFKCKICGHTTLTRNLDYRKEVAIANNKN